MTDLESQARELLAAELDAIRFPAMAAEVRDPDGYNTLGAAMVRVVAAALSQQRAVPEFTREQALAITGFTGVAACNFADFHEDVERRLGRPVWTHQFPSLMDEIKEAYREDFLRMCAAPSPEQEK